MRTASSFSAPISEHDRKISKDEKVPSSSSPPPASSGKASEATVFDGRPRSQVVNSPPAVARRPVFAPDDINESAEAFINRFKHQLQLQRLQSIENYNQMLARGLWLTASPSDLCVNLHVLGLIGYGRCLAIFFSSWLLPHKTICRATQASAGSNIFIPYSCCS